MLDMYCYLMVVLAIYDVEKIGHQVITPMGTIQMLLDGFFYFRQFLCLLLLELSEVGGTVLGEIASVFITWGSLYLCSTFRQRLTTWHRQFLLVVLNTVQQVGETLLSTPLWMKRFSFFIKSLISWCWISFIFDLYCCCFSLILGDVIFVLVLKFQTLFILIFVFRCIIVVDQSYILFLCSLLLIL